MPLGEGLSSYVIETNLPWHFTKEEQKVLEQEKKISKVIGSLSESWMGAPISVDDRVLGLIIIQSYSVDEIYDDGDLQVLSFVAANLSIVLQQRKYLEQQEIDKKAVEASLEKIQQQNIELENMMDELKQTQNELVQKEKMASLGNLVAGIAHEINTPLGTNVTSLSYLTNLMEAIQGKMEAGTLTVKDFKSFLEDGNHAVNIMSQNFTTMTGLVSRFKLVSVKQMNIEKANMHMAEYFNELIESYKEQYPDVLIQVNTHGIKEVESYPAAWTIIIDQLVENSVAHGFSTEQSKK